VKEKTKGGRAVDNYLNKIADAELEIMKVLWANEASMTDKQIRDALKDDTKWKRTTVQTLIKRLMDKGFLLRDKREVFYYSPAVTAAALEKVRTEDLLNKVFGGNAKNMVTAMINNNILSEGDLDELQSYWRKRRQGK
jgi:predicted transcriptional regulator